MSLEDNLACADLCEERGFTRQADLLRSAAEGRLRLHVVVERAVADGEWLAERGGVLQAVYECVEDAERDALRRNVAAFRERNLYRYSYGGGLEYMSDLPRDQLERRLDQIIPGYTIPPSEGHERPLFPSNCTDAQIRAVMGLFDLRLFYVVEAAFVA